MTLAIDRSTSQLPAETNGGEIARVIPSKRRALAAMADKFQVEPERLMQILKATVIRATDQHTPNDEEVAAFIIVANQYGLNPITREIHAFADPRRGIVPIIGIDGWAHIVNAHEQFDGCEFEEIRSDEDDIGTTCTMYVKGRGHPVRITEWLSECKRNTPPWNTMKRRMLRHKAFMQAARIAFSISGLYDEDEARDILQNQDAPSAAFPEKRGAKSDPLNRKLVDPVPDTDAGPEPSDDNPIPDPSETTTPRASAPAPASTSEVAVTVEPWSAFIERIFEAAMDHMIPERDALKAVGVKVLALKKRGNEESISVEKRLAWLSQARSGVLFGK